ncbi:response regulator [Aulosira sp. FACHB-615]|uniref:response regulator n=1 Tax=Aulosira sp. FACHB-615 TaxID=2692777 RepID=UPI001689F377|nr:response regulator [Aulosira sp. FACHB-615]MBD2486227.1 response regulator [Aulosira sp. FACHB-615]
MVQARCNVLIVDDSPEDREFYRQCLLRDRDYSYNIWEATLGSQGLELCQQQPDVILLDYRLPDLDGLEFLAQLKAFSQQPELPVIMVTGQGSEAIAVQVMKAGAQDYLVKEHITPATLQRAVQGAIETVQLRNQLQQRIKRERLTAQIIQKIHQSLDLQEILQTTVTEVRQFLHTDRVVIVRWQPDNSGIVTNESVGAGWTPLLSTCLYNPCFKEYYTEFAHQGLISVKPNIYDGTLNSWHIELLTNLQVQAKIVVPILQDQQLWGMLIVHHCQAPRQWQPLEIDLLQELATALGIALRQAELYQQTQHELIERRKVETELRANEERFRTSVENVLDCLGIYVAIRNEQGEIIDFLTEYVNHAACLNNHMSYEQQIGRGLCELLPGHRESGLFAEYCRVVESGQSLMKENLIYSDEYGEKYITRAFDIRVAKFGDGFIATWRDITHRKQAEQSLQESEERFRTLADNMSQFAWMADANGWIFWYNQRWFDYTGTTLEEMQGWGWQKVHHPDHLNRVIQHFRHCLTTGEAWEDTFPLRGNDGEYRWFLSRAIPIRDQHGEILRWFGTNTDITEQKQAEEERSLLLEKEQLARAEAERANRIKDEFLAILSHELRSPLNPILGWAKLLQTRQFDAAKTAEALATIERNAKLQCQLIDDLLDVAKILRGKLNIDEAPVNLVFVLEAALDTVRTAAIAKSILLHSTMPQIGQVSGDSARLQQIFWNLLSNAIKFTPAGGRVDVQLQRVDHQAQITISDTGKGIKPDFLPHIFESFRQEDASTTRKYGGLGLGLAIVRYLLEAHGGTIQADSPGEGLGATFTVKLPLLATTSVRSQPDELSTPELDLTGIKVLIVDDEPDARELVTAVLEQYGAEILAVTRAAEVLASLESFQPDVFISDIGMPDMDGHTLIQQIRSLPTDKGGKIGAIALSAYARIEDQQRSLSVGFQHHISKPLDLDKLVETVFELARKS